MPDVPSAVPAPTGDDTGRARRSEQELARLLAEQRRRHGDALEAVGVTREAPASLPSVRSLARDTGTGMWPLWAVGALAAALSLQYWVLYLLAGDISSSLGLSHTNYGFAGFFLIVATVVGAFGAMRVVHLWPRRAAVAVAGGLSYALLVGLTGLATSVLGFVFASALAGLGVGAAAAVHRPLLVDAYPPGARARALSAYRAAQRLGVAAGAVVVVVCVRGLDLTWRPAMLVTGALGMVAVMAAARLRDPGYGRLDASRARAAIDPGATDAVPEGEDRRDRRAFALLQHVLGVPSVRSMLLGYAVLGYMLGPVSIEMYRFLDAQWHQTFAVRGTFTAATAATAAAFLLAGGRLCEREAADPARLLARAGRFLLAGAAGVALGSVMPAFGLVVALTGAGIAVAALAAPMLDAALFTVVPAGARPHAAVATELTTVVVAAVLGDLFMTSVHSRFGYAPALFFPLVAAVAANRALRRAGMSYGTDLDTMVDDLVEDTEMARARRDGVHLPLLACRHVDFSYGQVQVLFDVSLTVDDGELVGLLGNNGAGKSTMLGVLSGLRMPHHGSVRLDGEDVTHLRAEERVGLGIIQVPGDRAVFSRLGVAENLRLYGYSLGRHRKTVTAALDTVFEVFPQLAARRNQVASTLSGGEQQMLALGKAFILRPRVLLVDELSLGLAPIVVGQLLPLVRQIRDQGTAVVLVEQSVNIALSLVDRLYFVEKGAVQFEGAATEFLGHEELLRAAVLEGAAATRDDRQGEGATQ